MQHPASRVVLQTINRRSCIITEKAPTSIAHSVLIVRALVGAFSVIVKTGGSSAALQSWCCTDYSLGGPGVRQSGDSEEPPSCKPLYGPSGHHTRSRPAPGHRDITCTCITSEHRNIVLRAEQGAGGTTSMAISQLSCPEFSGYCQMSSDRTLASLTTLIIYNYSCSISAVQVLVGTCSQCPV